MALTDQAAAVAQGDRIGRAEDAHVPRNDAGVSPLDLEDPRVRARVDATDADEELAALLVGCGGVYDAHACVVRALDRRVEVDDAVAIVARTFKYGGRGRRPEDRHVSRQRLDAVSVGLSDARVVDAQVVDGRRATRALERQSGTSVQRQRIALERERAAALRRTDRTPGIDEIILPRHRRAAGEVVSVDER